MGPGDALLLMASSAMLFFAAMANTFLTGSFFLELKWSLTLYYPGPTKLFSESIKHYLGYA